MSFAMYLESLKEMCVECDDVFLFEHYDALEDHVQLCSDLGHHRVLTDDDIVWKICGRCHGDGELKGWPGAYTESDRAEWSDDDYEDYRETRRRCEDCGGSGKVRDLTLAAYERPAVQQALNEFYDDEAMSRQERMMGA